MTMADEVFLLDSPAVEKAVMAHNTEVTRRRRFGKSSLNEIPEVSAAGAVVDDYTGYFKIVRDSETTFSVVDGGNPSSEFCGTTDIPGAENVAKATFTFNGSAFYIYLHAYKVDKNYFTIITDSDIASFDARLIGSVSRSGKITQSIKTHETLSYRKDWYL